MEAIEGKRAMPRFRPPFPAQVGLFGKPTNINNVKTLSYVPEIISKGGKWFADIGHDTSTGTAEPRSSTCTVDLLQLLHVAHGRVGSISPR